MICVHGNNVLTENCEACEAAGRVVFPETEATARIPDHLRRDLSIAALREIDAAAKVGALSSASGWFLNYGETNTRMEAFNVGHDAADEDRPFAPEKLAPADEPHRQAWIDGYTEGYEFHRLSNLPWHPSLPVIARWLVEYPDGDEALLLVIDRHIALLEQFFRGPFRPEVVRAHEAIKALLALLQPRRYGDTTRSNDGDPYRVDTTGGGITD